MTADLADLKMKYEKSGFDFLTHINILLNFLSSQACCAVEMRIVLKFDNLSLFFSSIYRFLLFLPHWNLQLKLSSYIQNIYPCMYEAHRSAAESAERLQNSLATLTTHKTITNWSDDPHLSQ